MPFLNSSSRLLKPFLYTSLAVVSGGAILYVSYRPRNIPGFNPAAVPPPKYGENGYLEPPRFPPTRPRSEHIADLKKSWSHLRNNASSENGEAGQNPGKGSEKGSRNEDEYDILVIGGGATGTGIALDAASRGLKVALVERDDFGSGTSSKSTKLVHGGVRYLEKAVWELDYSQYKLVKEALRERKYFLETAPHLSMWLPIMIPVQKWWQAPYFWAGTKFYDFLAGSEGIESSYFLTKSRAIDAFPMLRTDNLFGALVYYDGAHNDSRMNVSLAMTAALYGATVVNHVEVTRLEKGIDGKVCGATARDLIPDRNGLQSEEFQIRAKSVINATGPFTDAIRQMDDGTAAEIVAPSSGVHVILPGYYSPLRMGLIDPSTSDGRVIFFLPWEGNTIAGTTDAPTQITKDPIAGEDEISWILSEIRRYLAPDIEVRRSDVSAAWSGIRPLVKDPKAVNTESLVRNHLITTSDSGLITCAGGKWTTYRQMAEETVDASIAQARLQPRPLTMLPAVAGTHHTPNTYDDKSPSLDGSCQTHALRLIGAHGFSKTLHINLIQHYGLDIAVAKHLTSSYGDRAWTVAELCKPSSTSSSEFSAGNRLRGIRLSPLYPFVDGEVRHAVRHEGAQTAIDVLARRTRLAFLNARAALEALGGVIDLMAAELDWPIARKEREWTDSVVFLVSMGLKIQDDAVNERQNSNGDLECLRRLKREDVDAGRVQYYSGPTTTPRTPSSPPDVSSHKPILKTDSPSNR